MTLPTLTRREEAQLEAMFSAFRERYAEASRGGYVGSLLLNLVLGESNSGQSVPRFATIRREDQVRLNLEGK